MKTVIMPKAESNTIVIASPKVRGVMPPPTKIRPGKRRDDRKGNGKWKPARTD